MRTRLALVSAAAGATLALSGALLAAPTATAAPASPQCFQAQANVASQENVTEAASNKLSNDNVTLQAAKDQLAKAQAAVPVVPADIAAAQDAVSNAQVLVNNDQASLRTAQANLAAAIATRDKVCAPTPTPTTIPIPPPVGVPAQFGNCAQALRFGYHDIPSTDPHYRLILDRDRDGIACESNGDDTRPLPTTTTIISPPPAAPNTVVIVPPAPSGNNYSQIGQAPSGFANTGFGPDA